jgi:hypothetical protein
VIHLSNIVDLYLIVNIRNSKGDSELVNLRTVIKINLIKVKEEIVVLSRLLVIDRIIKNMILHFREINKKNF